MMRALTQACGLAFVLAALTAAGGCQVAKLAGGMAQANEDQKKIEVLAKYAGLENKTVAVLVTSDMSTQFEHPQVVRDIAFGVSGRIQKDVPGAKVLNPQIVIGWMYRTPQWEALPYGEIAEQLNVDRVVHIDLLEYRLNPPGNRYVWEGVCLGRVGIIERGGLDPDNFTETFDVNTKYPSQEGVTREDAAERVIAGGLQYDFVQRTTWLFHTHIEPKHPDRYRPELDTANKKKG